MADGTTNTQNWTDNLDSEVQESVSRFKSDEGDISAEKVANGYHELNKKLGRSLTLPDEKATDEEKAEQYTKIYTKLGRPETPEGYEIEKSEIEGLQWSDEVESNFKQFAHKEGLNKKQVSDAAKFYQDLRKSEIEAIQAQQKQQAETSIATLKKEWGNNFEGNSRAAQKAYDAYGGEELIELFDKTGLKNHPAVVKTFHNIYKDKMQEGNLVEGDGQTTKTAGALSYPSMD